MRISKLITMATIATIACIITTGCGTTQWADNAMPPTGWNDIYFAQTAPGNCQDHAYEYCKRLQDRGMEAKVLTVELNNGAYHAIVECKGKDGRTIYVDTTTGDVCYPENYAQGRVVTQFMYAVK